MTFRSNVRHYILLVGMYFVRDFWRATWQYQVKFKMFVLTDTLFPPLEITLQKHSHKRAQTPLRRGSLQHRFDQLETGEMWLPFNGVRVNDMAVQQ